MFGIFNSSRREAASAPCFHCGLPLNGANSEQVCVDGLARSVCCVACAAIVEAVVAAGYADYYRARDAAALEAASAHD